MGKYFVTTPIFYPNARPHLGNVYPTVLADVLARYHRLMGDETYFLTGTDENTQKMVDAALKTGARPKDFLDETVEHFKKTFDTLEISYDQFIRTTDQQLHWPGAIKMWNALVASGDIYKKEYEGLYCVGHEAFITEKDLVDGKCPDHGTAPEHLAEENYFFKLSKYGEHIKQAIQSGVFQIKPEERKNEILSLIDSGLEDVSFSRPKRDDWPPELGVPVPNDPSQVMYVWCDALVNYASAVGYGRDDALFEAWWPADVHVLGKDILRFHAALWPAMLISAGVPLPKTLLVHGLILSGGKKMSKSLGNVIDPVSLMDEYGVDAVRYYLTRHISPFNDGDMTVESFKDAYNGSLANGLGNLVARIMKLAEDNLTAPIMRPEPAVFPQELTETIEAFECNRAMDYIWTRIQQLDARITGEEPFKLVKTDLEAGKKLISELAVELYWIARFLNPFMPATSERIKQTILANKKPESLFKRID
ncbi:MAG: methionine--tRNA ligase [Patescibacteria group bacterium]